MEWCWDSWDFTCFFLFCFFTFHTVMKIWDFCFVSLFYDFFLASYPLWSIQFPIFFDQLLKLLLNTTDLPLMKHFSTFSVKSSFFAFFLLFKDKKLLFTLPLYTSSPCIPTYFTSYLPKYLPSLCARSYTLRSVSCMHWHCIAPNGDDINITRSINKEY